MRSARLDSVLMWTAAGAAAALVSASARLAPMVTASFVVMRSPPMTPESSRSAATTRQVRVVVVGGGAIGAASALALARAGHVVTVLDHLGPANALGSSHGGARIFRLAYDEPDYVELARCALPRGREIEQLSGTALLTTTGGIDHGAPASVDAVRAAMAAAGAESEMLSAAR